MKGNEYSEALNHLQLAEELLLACGKKTEATLVVITYKAITRRNSSTEARNGL